MPSTSHRVDPSTYDPDDPRAQAPDWAIEGKPNPDNALEMIQQHLPATIVDEWETVPTGYSRVEWGIDVQKEGTFTEVLSIDLGEQNDNEQANQLGFIGPDGEQWSSWETQQLTANRFNVGDYYRITCVNRIKTANGHMYQFRVQRRK